MERIAVGILGGTGYGAAELLRLLAGHDLVDVVGITSTTQAGASVSAAHPQLEGFYKSLRFESELDLKSFSNASRSFVFAGLPHGQSAASIAQLLKRPGAEKLKIIDLSGDFRLANAAEREKYYPESKDFAPLGAEFVYGLSELNREKITTARFVANPGCLASSCALAALPLMTLKFRGRIIFDAKTGSSGGGRSLADTMHHPFRHANVNAYKVMEHRHEPEIRQSLLAGGGSDGERIETVFVPHLLPISRGIFSTAYLELEREYSSSELQERYREFYKGAPFIRIRAGSPDLQTVIGSNFCDISVISRGRQVVAMAVLDNLVKGMAGQAIQNMNLMAGLPETSGLLYPSLSLL